MSSDAVGVAQGALAFARSRSERPAFVSALPTGAREHRLAIGVVLCSLLLFLAAVPFAKYQLPQVWAFVPIYESALVVNDFVTAVLLFGQFRYFRSRALLVLAGAYLFSALIAVSHALTFPGLFAPSGLLGAGPQSTAWLYMFWHGGFPLAVVVYATLKERIEHAEPVFADVVITVAAAAAVSGALTLLATAGQDLLPAIMDGNRYTRSMTAVVSSTWALSLVALVVLWRRRPHSVLDLWLMVVMCAWLFDIALSAVLNAGRFDLGFYAGRIYGFLASAFVLGVLLMENGRLYARLAQRQARHAARLRILHEIDRAVLAEHSPEAVAAAVIRPLRELLGVPRAIVNKFDIPAGEVEWVAAAGRKRSHIGPGVRYSLKLMGDIEGLRRGEPQYVDVKALPPSAEVDALLASEVNVYAVVPIKAGAELIGAISFGGQSREFQQEDMEIAQEVAAQLAIAMRQTQLLQRVKGIATELEQRVRERTAALDALNQELQTLNKAKQERIAYLTLYDPLTGLANAAMLQKHLQQWLHAAEQEQERLAVLVFNIERFKLINDSFGRQAGDELLKQVAERLLQTYGDPTRVARIGADHFALVSAGIHSDEELARRIEDHFEHFFGQPYQVAGTELRLSAKMGIALFPNDARDPETLFKNAEAALKKAKEMGERYLFFAQDMTDRIHEQLSLENKLRRAVEKEEFILHYQPKVDLERNIVGLEALIRWQSPELGLVPPGKFISLLEETGLILEVGDWALLRAAQDLRSWLQLGLLVPPVAVNVSAVQLRQRDFVDRVRRALKEVPLPAALDLEITESLIMQDVEGNIQKLNALRKHGVNIAIDDFGTGYSSLGYLAKLPVQSLKIDRSFIVSMQDEPNSMTLISTIIQLAHSLRLKVVAEGVESEEQAKFLRLLRCDEMQGFLFSKPLPKETLVELLRKAPSGPRAVVGGE